MSRGLGPDSGQHCRPSSPASPGGRDGEQSPVHLPRLPSPACSRGASASHRACREGGLRAPNSLVLGRTPDTREGGEVFYHPSAKKHVPQIEQRHRKGFKCDFLRTAVFGLRFIPITVSDLPIPNSFPAVNNAQRNECLITFLGLLYKYTHI